jgi:effector-binding domain-containing protein
MTGFHLAPVWSAAALAIGLAWSLPLSAQTRLPTQPIDAFGQEVVLPARPIVYVAGSGTWDAALETLTGAFKRVGAYVDKAGLKASGPPMTIYTATTNTDFKFEAAVPLAEAPKAPSERDIMVGESPSGKALKFVHRGTFRDLGQTYEAIANFFDAKGLDIKGVLIEEYVTDLASAPETKLVVNVFVPPR